MTIHNPAAYQASIKKKLGNQLHEAEALLALIQRGPVGGEHEKAIRQYFSKYERSELLRQFDWRPNSPEHRK